LMSLCKETLQNSIDWTHNMHVYNVSAFTKLCFSSFHRDDYVRFSKTSTLWDIVKRKEPRIWKKSIFYWFKWPAMLKVKLLRVTVESKCVMNKCLYRLQKSLLKLW